MVRRMRLSGEDSERIAEMVAAAETRTSGEIVVVVAEASDRYLAVPLALAAAFALLVPLVLPFLPVAAMEYVLPVQVAVFAALLLLFASAPARARVTPSAWRDEAVRVRAEAEFLRRGVDATEGRTGLLVYVSLAEHDIEILADRGLAARVPAGAWEEAVDVFRDMVRRDGLAEALVAVVASCGKVLAEHAPRRSDDRDELPNVPREV